jgi:AcrR family transcriptional regulator
MRAGIEVFSKRPYFDTTIDDLIRAAGISRAAFYMHFESKLDLAFAVFDASGDDWRTLFAELPAIVERDLVGLRGWMGRHLVLYRARIYVPRLHAELDQFEPRFQERMDELYDELIDNLGKSIPAFAPALHQTAKGRRARIRAKLLIEHIGTVCASLAARGSVADESIYLDLLTGEFTAFLRETGSEG